MSLPQWITESFKEHSILWFFVSAVVGGVFGAMTKFVFEIWLPRSLVDRKASLEIKRQLETPLILAAGDLCARLTNMMRYIDSIEKEGWLPKEYKDNYYFLSTLFVTARLFGWIRILRRRVVFLDFATTRETIRFEQFLRAILSGFSQPRFISESHVSDPGESHDKWIFSYWIETIGDGMIVGNPGEERTSDFAGFCRVLRTADAELKEALVELTNIYVDIKVSDPRFRRLVGVQCILNLFLENMDKRHTRVRKMEYFSYILNEKERELLRRQLPKEAAKRFDCLGGDDFPPEGKLAPPI